MMGKKERDNTFLLWKLRYSVRDLNYDIILGNRDPYYSKRGYKIMTEKENTK